MGNVDRCNRIDSSISHMADIRRNDPGSYHSRCILSMCTCISDTNCNYGSNRKCNEAWISCERGRCVGTSCIGVKDYI